MKHKTLKPNNGSALKKFIFSYLLILCVPIIFTTVTLTTVSSSIKKATEDETFYMLSLLQTEMDTLFNSLKKSGYSLIISTETNLFENTPEGRSDYTAFIKKQRMVSYNSEDFAVYFKEENLIVSSTGYYTDPRNYYDSYFYNTNISYDDFYNTMLCSSSSRFVPIRNIQTGVESIQYVLPSGFDPELRSVCVITSLSAERYTSVIRSMEKKLNTSVMVLNKRNEKIFAGTQDTVTTDYRNYPADRGMIISDIDGTAMVQSYISSDIADWKYISIKPEREFWQRSYYIRTVWLFTLLSCLLIGLTLVIVLTRKSYNPIKKLTDEMKKIGTPHKSENEFQIIEDTVKQIVSQYNDLSDYLKSQKRALTGIFLGRLLRNELDTSKSVFSELQKYDIAFPYQNYLVLIIRASNLEELFADDNDRELALSEKVILTDLILSNIALELLKEKYIAVSAEIDEKTVIILNTDNTDPNTVTTDVNIALHQLCEVASAEFKLHLLCAVSNLHQTIDNLPSCYLEAEKALALAGVYLSDTSIVHYEAIRQNHENTGFYSFDSAKQLENWLKAGNAQMAKRAISEFIENNCKNITSLPQVKGYVFLVATTLSKTYYDLYSVAGIEKTTTDEDIFEALDRCKNSSEMLDILYEAIDALCLSVNEDQDYMHNNVSNRVKAIVNAHYSNSNLSVGMIGDMVELVPNYLSTVFKKQTGQSLLDYIQSVRIQMAKELLRDSNRGLKDISIEVGFTNTDSFTRVFKKHEGITPGQYRKQQRQNQ